jgi:predicted methyltransferase MtxX (methanogen marker protein 4)
MGDRVAVNGLVLSPVDAEVGLAVAVQIKLAQSHAAFDRELNRHVDVKVLVNQSLGQGE